MVSMGEHRGQRRLLRVDGRGRQAENTIFAEPTTWTGSIGVIIPHYDLSGCSKSWTCKTIRSPAIRSK